MKSLVSQFFKKTSRLVDLLFLLVMVLWLLLFFYFSGVPEIQTIVALLFVISYFFWGVSTHYLENTLHLKNVLEYLLISFIGFVLITFLVIS